VLIDELQLNQIFVFGSNLSGIHGAGAAKTAMQSFGAMWGLGTGYSGQTYAIPTKDEDVAKSLTIEEIKPYVRAFVAFACMQPHLEFLITRIGCGLAGYTDAEMAPLFAGLPENCILPEEWIPYVQQPKAAGGSNRSA
jgi:hypothetical protein